ncbi:beta strand repeat-containing protein [Gimesia sp.]|uniref:beta strand repeat-containing protein n=1 Tax=Gimesia sp. TaxID=2024833 RepID=UPI003A900738
MKIAFRLIAGVIVLAISAMSGTLLAEDEVEFPTIIADGSETTDTLDGISSVVPGNGMGTLFRVGHQAGKTVGLDESISHIEAMPYLFTHTKNPDDAGMMFGNFRLWRTNRGNLGGGAGLGYRFYNYDTDRIFGASFYYDRDDSTDKIFQQLALNVETMGRYWDANGNFYLPIGNRRQQLNLEFNEGSQRYSGFNILYDQTRTIGKAMRGFDAEIGVPIWGDLAQQFQARAYAGTYGFQATDSQDVWGWRGRLQAYPLPNVLTELSITSDDTFNTNVFFNVTWTFAGRPEWNEMEKSTQMYRMAERIRKNYNVVIEQSKVVDSGLVAINPATGLPWTVSHVDSYASPGGTGSVLDPYQTIPDAQAGPDRDIIFTHAGSEYTNASPITLVSGDRILGEGQGVDHYFDIQGFGSKLLPNSPLYGSSLRPNSLVRPTFNDTVGDGVILASDSEFSGFILNNPSARGIVGIGVSETTVNYVDVNNAVDEGIYLNSTSGSLAFLTTNVTNSAGDAFVVDGGDPLIRYESGTITNTGAGRAVLIQNTTGGSVNMTASLINDTSSQGVLINNIGGGAVLDNVTITGSTNEGIHVTGGSANAVVTIRNTAQAATVIDSATGASIFVEDYSGVFQMQDINIVSRNSTGILVENLAGNMSVVGNTTISDGTSLATDHGIDINNTSGNISFGGNIGILGSAGEGISFNAGGNTGTFSVSGTTTISGTTNEAFIVLDDSPVIRMGNMVLSNNSTTSSVLYIDNAGQGGTAGSVSFNNTTVTGTTNATVPVVHILNNTPIVSFGSLNISANSVAYTTPASYPIVTAPVGLYVHDNPGNVDFGDLNITAIDNLAFIANDNAGTLSSSGGIITVTDAAAIDIEDSSLSLNLTSVTAGPTNGPDLNTVSSTGDNAFYLNSAGIRLVRTPGLFSIAGDGATIDSGGTITSATHGVWMEDIGRVNLDGLEIQIPTVSGIEWHETDVDDGPRVNLARVRVEDSLGDGIRIINGRTFQMTDSELLDNGTDATEHSIDYLANIELTDTDDDAFTIILQNNTITDDSADAIRIQSGGLLDDSFLSVNLEGNSITNSVSDTAGLSVIWEGPQTILVSNANTFIGTGATNNQGINIDATSNDLADLLTLQVSNNNNFTIAGTNSEGIQVSTEGPSNILITSNLDQGIVMAGVGSTGIRFLDLAANSNVQIDNNFINMTASGGDGIFFDLINATNSSVIIDANTIGLFDGSVFANETAVGFNAMTNGPLTLGTGVNNIVNVTTVGNNNSFILFNPGGGTFDGQISLNGFLLP